MPLEAATDAITTATALPLGDLLAQEELGSRLLCSDEDAQKWPVLGARIEIPPEEPGSGPSVKTAHGTGGPRFSLHELPTRSSAYFVQPVLRDDLRPGIEQILGRVVVLEVQDESLSIVNFPRPRVGFGDPTVAGRSSVCYERRASPRRSEERRGGGNEAEVGYEVRPGRRRPAPRGVR
jgi:hypothetical protein